MSLPRNVIRVLFIDDSAATRLLCAERLPREPGIQVLGLVTEPAMAVRRIVQDNPDVVVVDIDMPRCNGVQIVRQIMQERPRPIVIFSALSGRNAELGMAAMAAGAISSVKKPQTTLATSLQATALQLVTAIREAANAQVRRIAQPMAGSGHATTAQALIRQHAAAHAPAAPRSTPTHSNVPASGALPARTSAISGLAGAHAHAAAYATAVPAAVPPSAIAPAVVPANGTSPAGFDGLRSKQSADAMLPTSPGQRALPGGERLIAIGASTGGTQALEQVLTQLPTNLPGIVIVQHMPEKFSTMFAARLNELCKLEIREARHGDKVRSGLVLVAPGGKHMMVRRSGSGYHVDIADGPLVNRHKPSVDLMFGSVALAAGASARGFILTGMGDDGARGMREMHDAGARTVAQDEFSCVVFGMPKVAIALGGVDKVVPLDRIHNEIMACAHL